MTQQQELNSSDFKSNSGLTEIKVISIGQMLKGAFSLPNTTPSTEGTIPFLDNEQPNTTAK